MCKASGLFADDDGSITVEAALSLSALVVVFTAMVSALISLGAYLSAIDIAGAAARAYAIGVAYTPPKGDIAVVESAGLVTVTATVPAVMTNMHATAIFPKEQS